MQLKKRVKNVFFKKLLYVVPHVGWISANVAVLPVPRQRDILVSYIQRKVFKLFPLVPRHLRGSRFSVVSIPPPVLLMISLSLGLSVSKESDFHFCTFPTAWDFSYRVYGLVLCRLVSLCHSSFLLLGSHLSFIIVPRVRQNFLLPTSKYLW